MTLLNKNQQCLCVFEKDRESKGKRKSSLRRKLYIPVCQILFFDITENLLLHLYNKPQKKCDGIQHIMGVDNKYYITVMF